MSQSSWSEKVTTKYIDLDDKELCTWSGLQSNSFLIISNPIRTAKTAKKGPDWS